MSGDVCFMGIPKHGIVNASSRAVGKHCLKPMQVCDVLHLTLVVRDWLAGWRHVVKVTYEGGESSHNFSWAAPILTDQQARPEDVRRGALVKHTLVAAKTINTQIWRLFFIALDLTAPLLFLDSKSRKFLLFEQKVPPLCEKRSRKFLFFVRKVAVLLTPELPSKKILPVKRTLEMKKSNKRAGKKQESSGRPNKPIMGYISQITCVPKFLPFLRVAQFRLTTYYHLIMPHVSQPRLAPYRRAKFALLFEDRLDFKHMCFCINFDVGLPFVRPRPGRLWINRKLLTRNWPNHAQSSEKRRCKTTTTCIGRVHFSRGRGGVVDRLLTSNLGKPGSISGRVAPGFSHLGIVSDHVWPLLLHSGTVPYFSRFIFIGSQDLAANQEQNSLDNDLGVLYSYEETSSELSIDKGLKTTWESELHCSRLVLDSPSVESVLNRLLRRHTADAIYVLRNEIRSLFENIPSRRTRVAWFIQDDASFNFNPDSEDQLHDQPDHPTLHSSFLDYSVIRTQLTLVPRRAFMCIVRVPYTPWHACNQCADDIFLTKAPYSIWIALMRSGRVSGDCG
ncbi:hypothetical protein PR048_020416 [Dryococelus australis]|uniref:Uncharacterized protein n=1 Tax=Dryococelus australis TaxID=614101 RepID=A0ABQ9H6B6_9NEOP|nr:hypothetical protein PR048_020416 [Dryococelus australis]